MKKTIASLLAGTAILASGQAAVADGHVEEITVAYFLEWPMPFQFAKVEGMYEEAMGVSINWVAFDTGVAMSAAMASGDVHLSVSQGLPPFIVATSAGQDLELLDVAVSYADNDNCVVAEALEIDASNTADLAGATVGVPLGTAAHFGFLAQMNHFGVDVASMNVVDMAPADGAAAFAQGELDMVCGWGGALRRMLENGNVLLTGDEKTELGILVFDVTSAPASFVAENPELVEQFLAVTAEANAMWNSGEHTDTMLPVIANDAGMDETAAAETLATFVFPSVEEQLSSAWLGGNVGEFMTGVATVFADAGSIDGTLDSYSGLVNIEPLRAIAQ